MTEVLSPVLTYFSIILGWGYFAAWSLSFYPQVIENWWRKSVVGLSFDFLTLNIIGHTSYLVFNSVMFWSDDVFEQYKKQHGNPNATNPVELNDVVFSIHAVTLTAFTIFQTMIYERGGQTISVLARGISLALLLAINIGVFLVLGHRIEWVNFLQELGYIKLVITTIKYIPPAWINYKRKLTIGWSIGNIILDFTGGSLSVLQMVVNGINSGDWSPFYGDFVKTGLGFLSMGFDIIFIVQHYILYRKNNKKYHEELKAKQTEKPILQVIFESVWMKITKRKKIEEEEHLEEGEKTPFINGNDSAYYYYNTHETQITTKESINNSSENQL
ncbi:hypothetical protein ABK040_007823 [Willaertia magna]